MNKKAAAHGNGNLRYAPIFNVGNKGAGGRGPPLISEPPSEIIDEFPNDDEFFKDLDRSEVQAVPTKKFRFNPGQGSGAKKIVPYKMASPVAVNPPFNGPRPNLANHQAPHKSQPIVDKVRPKLMQPGHSSAPITKTNVGQSSRAGTSNAFSFSGKVEATEAPPFTNERPLCFLTAPLSAVKQWCRYRQEAPTLVEVIGMLVSVEADAKNPAVKWLKLREHGSGELDCKFCEIDRPLPKLAPQQWYRCVGPITKDGHLLCVSIRAATNQELKWRPTLMSSSAKTWYRRMAKLNET